MKTEALERLGVLCAVAALFLGGCSTMPPSRLRIDEPGRAGSNGFSVQYPAELMSVSDVRWEPKKLASPIILPPHWYCQFKKRGKNAGFIWVESDANRKNREYVHGPDGPFLNAAHMFEALTRELEFSWGGATSLVTIYADGITGLRANNQDLVYVVKGRTRDGRWWVTGMFPIEHPTLPHDWNDPRAQSKDDRDYDKDGVRISGFSPESFAPPMSVYDKIVGSLTFPK